MGIDEIQWQHGHRYLTLVYQIDPGHTRLLWVGKKRRVKTLLGFFPVVRPRPDAGAAVHL